MRLHRHRQSPDCRNRGASATLPDTQIGRPKTSIKKDPSKLHESTSPPPETDSDAGAARAKPKRKTDTEYIPMWKVILMGDEEYEEKHVVEVLRKSIPKMDKKEARRIFREAQSAGEAIVVVATQEHAEFYETQLKRGELYVRIEPDQ